MFPLEPIQFEAEFFVTKNPISQHITIFAPMGLRTIDSAPSRGHIWLGTIGASRCLRCGEKVASQGCNSATTVNVDKVAQNLSFKGYLYSVHNIFF